MRIAVITTSYPSHDGDPSGHFVRTEVRELENAGHQVKVITPIVRPLGDNAFGWPGVGARLKEDPRRGLSALAWGVRARSELRGSGPFDRVVAHWAVPCGWPIVTALEGREHGPALEVVSHGGDVRLLLAAPPLVRRYVVRALARRAIRWRFVSAALRDSLLTALDPDVRRLVRADVMPSPIEVPDVRDEAVRRRASLPGGGLVAVTVGRLVPLKRIDRVLEHAAHVRPKALVVVGDGPERARLEEVARSLQVPAHFVGLVERREALAWIGAADVLWHASKTEGLSTVIREAEALGVRVEWC